MSTSIPKRNVALLCFLPDYGHVFPLLEIARQFKASGHGVVCYLPEECRTITAKYQLPYVSLGPCLPPDHEAVFRELSGRSDWYLICSENWDLQLRYWLPIKIALLPAFVKVRDALSTERPDCLLADSHVFGDWYLALSRMLGIPLLRNHTEGTYRWRQRWYQSINGLGAKPEWVMTLWEHCHRVCRSVLQNVVKLRHVGPYLLYRRTRPKLAAVLGTACDGAGGKLPAVVDFATGLGVLERKYLSHLVDTRGEERLFFAPAPYRVSTALPESLDAWFRGASGLPVVYLGFGTMAQLSPRFVRAVVDGLRRLEVAALWAMPASQQRHLRGIDLPQTVRVESFVPQPAVLAHPAVACFVCHAGAGGLREGLTSGKPMLCIPFLWDQPYNASVIEVLGAGKVLHKRAVTAERFARHLEDLLSDPAYRQRCEQLSQDLEQHRTAHPVQEVLDALSRTSRNQTG